MENVELVPGDLVMLSDVGNRLLSAAIAHADILTNTEYLLEDLKVCAFIIISYAFVKSIVSCDGKINKLE